MIANKASCAWASWTVFLMASGVTLAACGGDRSAPADADATTTTGDPGPTGTSIEGDDATEFISHLPGQSSGTTEANASDSATSGTSTTGGAVAGPADSNGDGAEPSAERAITEADILKVEGDTLYALSSYSGLTIIDLSDPTDLKVLGNHRSTATPFEMYVEGGTAYIMFNDYGTYEWDEELQYYVYRSSSRLQAVDVSTPSSPQLLGEKDMPGEISDSRKVGDVVYVVTHQSSYCWGCDAVANTRISSFDVSDPSVFNPVDEERFATENESWGRRSVSASPERMYVSGWSWGEDGQPDAGTIQVVDISDPNGQIEPGASVTIGGRIESRWQMDEYDGVLRVISQAGGWSSLTAPVVETFRINSSTAIEPLGSLSMVLPRPEDLRSVRFDGDRGFAVTFERTDPLFTIDLSDPANPVQRGELEIPGWLYHMEPRGDRLYALGFDQDVDNGALHVSIFDVASLDAPTMLDRVNFGGDWAYLSEDQDRVHKLFNLALDQQLILLPYSGSGYDEESCSYNWGSGIQLIDALGDDLVLRGVAPQVGTARRALLHNDVLFGISDNAVQAFDISDRDAPERIDRLDVARNVSQVKVVDDSLLRFGQNWWTGEVELDLVGLDQPETAQADASLDLSGLTEIETRSCNDGSYYSYSSFSGQVFTHGSFAFVPRQLSESGNDGSVWFNTNRMIIEVVDLSGGVPQIVGEIELEATGYNEALGDYSYYAGFVQTETALLIGRGQGYYSFDPATGTRAEPTFAYDIIDLSAGAEASVVKRLEVPSLYTRGGWGHGVYGCMIDMNWGWYGYYGYGGLALVSGNIVASQHEEALSDGSGRVRYYLDRVDLSDPENPQFLEPVNIPGQLLAYQHAEQRLVTLDYLPQVVDVSRDECYRVGYGAQFVYDQAALEASNYDYQNTPGTCTRWQRRLNSLVLQDGSARRVSVLRLDSDTDQGRYTSSQLAITDSHIFYQRFGYADDGWQLVNPELVALGLSSDGKLESLGSIAPELKEPYANLVARGNRAFLSSMGNLEVITSADGRLEQSTHELRSYGCYSDTLEVVGDQLLCAQGPYGIQSIPLD